MFNCLNLIIINRKSNMNFLYCSDRDRRLNL